jgi:hypothetical protein
MRKTCGMRACLRLLVCARVLSTSDQTRRTWVSSACVFLCLPPDRPDSLPLGHHASTLTTSLRPRPASHAYESTLATLGSQLASALVCHLMISCRLGVFFGSWLQPTPTHTDTLVHSDVARTSG